MSDDGTFEYDEDIDPVKTYERKVSRVDTVYDRIAGKRQDATGS